MKRVLLTDAYVLNRRAYRETSFLLEIFTKEQGRVSVVAKGARKAKSALPGLLQPFLPLCISLQGRGDLLTLTHAEVTEYLSSLPKEALFAGFYLNELVTYLLPKWAVHVDIFQLYAHTLLALKETPRSEIPLRIFEKYLLQSLGYDPLLKNDATLPARINRDNYYRFIPDVGFVLSERSETEIAFLGAHLLKIAAEEWDVAVLKTAKRLTRLILMFLLSGRELNSRRLFLPPEGERK